MERHYSAARARTTGRVTREFINDDDWFHNAENYIYFYHLGMADPTNAETRRRAQRFAGFYLNDDPAVPNYDPEHHIVRSPCSGSKGPLLQMRRGEIHYDLTHDHATLGPNFDFTRQLVGGSRDQTPR